MVNPGPVPHVGGPILTGLSSVLIGNKPAARVTDKAQCNAPPDSIAMGAPNVLIGHKMAARIGDPTVHGGVIVQGLNSVLIGTHPQGVVLKAAARSGVAFCEECARRKAEARARKLQPRKQTTTTAASHARGSTTSTTPTSARNPRAINVDRALARLGTRAYAHPQGKCLRHVREAIEAGGASPGRTLSARNYGPNLERAGFTPVATRDSAGFVPQRGDVVVFQAVPGHPHGHVAMYDGAQWVSDFRQRGFYIADVYRSGSFTVYRP